MSEFVARSDENTLDYARRLIQGKKDGIYDIDYVEMYELLFGKSISSTESRKRSYGILDMLELLENENINSNGYQFEDIMRKTEDLKKERIKLQQVNAENNKRLRKIARGELFQEQIIDAVKATNPNLNHIEKKSIATKDKEGVLLIADSHYGKTMTIKSVNGDVINEYSPEIFKRRMADLFNETLAIIEKEKLEKIHIFNLGDSIEGILRFKETLPESGILTAIMEYITFMRDWLQELSKHVAIEYYQSNGNHSSWRILDGKKDTFPQENAERLIVWTLKPMLENNKNIVFHDEQVAGLTYADVLGYKFLASHGDKLGKVDDAIRDYSMLYGIDIDYLVLGHKHINSTLSVAIGKEVIQCSSLIGVDDYAIEKLRRSNDAGCRLLVIEKDKGKAIDYNIVLK